jgi:hypothetical protein
MMQLRKVRSQITMLPQAESRLPQATTYILHHWNADRAAIAA